MTYHDVNIKVNKTMLTIRLMLQRGKTVLMYAAAGGTLEVAKFLHFSGANLNCKDRVR